MYLAIKHRNVKVAKLLIDINNVSFRQSVDTTDQREESSLTLEYAIKTKQTAIAEDILDFVKNNATDIKNVKDVWFYFCSICCLLCVFVFLCFVFFFCVRVYML